MIIYGWKGVHLKSAKSKRGACPNCEAENSLILSVFRMHAHLFWIPMFPYGKKGVAQCQNCGYDFDIKGISGPVNKSYNELKDDAKGPIWQFAGLGIIALLIIWFSHVGSENKKLELEYLASPKEGDVYECKIEKGSYSTFKIDSVSEDSIFVFPNEYEINKSSGIKRIDKPENYAEWSYGISKENIKEMYNSKVIIDINRE